MNIIDQILFWIHYDDMSFILTVLITIMCTELISAEITEFINKDKEKRKKENKES